MAWLGQEDPRWPPTHSWCLGWDGGPHGWALAGCWLGQLGLSTHSLSLNSTQWLIPQWGDLHLLPWKLVLLWDHVDAARPLPFCPYLLVKSSQAAQTQGMEKQCPSLDGRKANACRVRRNCQWPSLQTKSWYVSGPWAQELESGHIGPASPPLTLWAPCSVWSNLLTGQVEERSHKYTEKGLGWGCGGWGGLLNSSTGGYQTWAGVWASPQKRTQKPQTEVLEDSGNLRSPQK